MSDALLDAIIGAPDDDAPRLVWADREGGERGELVVIQCALAREGLDPAERKRLAGRENTLLRNVPRWMGSQLARPRFVRGFVDDIEVRADELARIAGDLFVREPILGAVTVTDLAEDVNRYDGPYAEQAWSKGEAALRTAFEAIPPRRVRALVASPRVRSIGEWDMESYDYFGDDLVALVAELPSLAGLQDLRLLSCGVTEDAIPHLARLQELRALTFSDAHIDGRACGKLIAVLPSLRTFAPHSNRPRLNDGELDRLLSSDGIWHLRKLDVSQNDLSEVDKMQITMALDLGPLQVIIE